MKQEVSQLILFRGLLGAEEDCALAARLVALAERYGFDGDLWKAYLAYALLRHENPWSLACEGTPAPEGTLAVLAARDMEVVLRLFRGNVLAPVPELRDYRPAAQGSIRISR